MKSTTTPWVLLALGAVAGCTSAPLAPGKLESAVFVNGGFEGGTNNTPPPAPWTVTGFLTDKPGITIQHPQTRDGLNLQTSINGTNPVLLTNTLVAPGGPGTGNDRFVGAGATLHWPKYGNAVGIVNQAGKNQNVNQLSQRMTVSMADVDPSDHLAHVRFVVAPVLEVPPNMPPNVHTDEQKPYFFVQLTNLTTTQVLYANYNFSNQAGVPWTTVTTATSTFVYTNWQLIDIAPGAAALKVGDQVEIQFIAAGCSLGGHMGQLYVDSGDNGASLPDLFVSGSAPSQVDVCSALTYTLKYQNGTAAAASGVKVTFNTPPNTTFLSIVPPPGVTNCTMPGLGGTGAVVCPIGNLAAGASGSFQVTVKVPCMGADTITAGNYFIESGTTPPLLGSVINTFYGCTNDQQCTGGKWCNETASQCTPTLPNGTLVPTDPPHTGPVLNGQCTTGAATLVCTSAVCDPADNKCGLLNGDGPCTAATGATVCRSGVCDPDGKCGFAVGDGPCTATNGATVCRSGACSANGTCEPAGGCNVDADCSGGKWCLESMHTCTNKLNNGTQLPTDPPHTGPTLNGACTAPAAMLVCVSAVCDINDNKCGYANGDGTCNPASAPVVCRSGVCDPDGRCGYANGDGPCTVLNGGTVCRSGQCSVNGTCEPAGGCNVDGDCSGGNWCNEQQHMCTPKLPNGMQLPIDPPHSGPVLNGQCTAAAAMLVCQSLVCDLNDNKCGFADGDGPCTAVNQGQVCRSGVCSADGTCRPDGGCNVDADCTGGNWCNEQQHMCTPKLPNGTQLPTDPPHKGPTLDGTCTPLVGPLVCQSGVCDPDGKCGFANGDGPCTVGNQDQVCRSGSCSVNLTCKPVDGCNVDADCSGGKWCNEVQHMCMPKLPNGSDVPNDPPHTTPKLDGTCTPAAGTLVCVSGVCDTHDNKCGYGSGDGPCTPDTAPTVCRSGVCSTNGTCTPMGGCNVDQDCSGGKWCNEQQHMCMPKLPNGSGVPSDPPHMTPKLDGTCTPAAGTLVCQSSVCDPADNKCGYADGDGPCTPANGDVVCRSGVCTSAGHCRGANGCDVDTDCTAPGQPYCDLTTHTCGPRPSDHAFDGGGFCSVAAPGARGGASLPVGLALVALVLLRRRARVRV